MPTNKALKDLQPTIISYAKDLPNLCSLAGLACTVSAIYFCIIGIYYAANDWHGLGSCF